MEGRPLVSGASGQLGRLTARLLLAEGAEPIIVSRSPSWMTHDVHERRRPLRHGRRGLDRDRGKPTHRLFGGHGILPVVVHPASIEVKVS